MNANFGHGSFQEAGKPTHRVNPGRGLVTVLDFACVSHLRASLLILVCALAFFLPGFFAIPPLDREESTIAQTTKQMIENDDYVDLRFQHKDQQTESVATHWVQALAVRAVAATGLPRTPVRIFPYRLPSLIGALGAVLATYWAALAFTGRRGAVLASLTLCATILLGFETRLARPDALMLLCVTTALAALARIYLDWQRGDDPAHPHWHTAGIFWAALIAGLVLDGPLLLVYILLPVATLIVADRSAGWLPRLQPLWGVVSVALAMVLWGVSIHFQGGDIALMFGTLGNDVVGKLANWSPVAGGWPGTHFLLFWVLFWPGAVLAGLAAPAIWRARTQPGAQFLLAWLVPTWIVAELLLPKWPHMMLPLYPAAAILVAGAVERRALADLPWLARGTAWWFGIPAVVSVAAVIASIALTRQPAFAAWPFAAGAMVLGLFAWWLYDIHRGERSLLNAIGASLLMSVTVFGVLAPALTPLFPSVELSRIVRNLPCDKPVAAAAGYQEPSLVFMAGTSTVLTDAPGAADFLQQGPCRVAIVDARLERAFALRAESIGLLYSVVSRIDAYNYSLGRKITVAVFRSDDAQ